MSRGHRLKGASRRPGRWADPAGARPAAVSPRALACVTDRQDGPGLSAALTLLLFAGAFLCMWSPQKGSPGPSWGGRGGLCEEGRRHYCVQEVQQQVFGR